MAKKSTHKKSPGLTQPLPAQLKSVEKLLNAGKSVEEMERFDIGRLYMNGQRFEAALHWLDGLEFFAARNNRALTLYHLERIDEALEISLASWERDPDNLFALGWAARLRLYRGDDTGARGLCTPLAAATARRVEDATGQLGALLFLGHDQAAWDAFERVRRADWFKPGKAIDDVLLRHFGACAASRLGHLDEARRLWREAAASRSELRLPADNLARLDETREAAAFPMVFESKPAAQGRRQ